MCLRSPGRIARGRSPPAQSLQEALASNLETLREKTVALARATPQEKLGHKVHPDVRSLGDELTVESPEETARALDASFDYVIAAVRGITDLNATAQIRRSEMSMNAYLTMMITHLHEHLGKSISDARAAGIVPPWSEGE